MQIRPSSRRDKIVLGLILLAVAASSIYAAHSEDLGTYVRSGRAVLLKQNIYTFPQEGGYTYPPLFSVLCVPLALMDNASPYLVRTVWILMTWMAMLAALHLVARLVYGKSLSLSVSAPESSLWVGSRELITPMALSILYYADNFAHLQIDALLFALTLGGLYQQTKGRSVLGGGMLGAAAATKVMAVVFLPYLIYRRRWRALASGVVTTVALSLSPALVFGQQTFLRDLATWSQVARSEWGSRPQNLSVLALWDRVIGYRILPFTLTRMRLYSLPWSGDPRVKVAYGLTLGIALLASLVIFREPPVWGSPRSQLEWGVVFIASAIFSPVCWAHHLVVVLLLNAVLYQAWRRGGLDSRSSKILGGILFVSFLFSIPLPRLFDEFPLMPIAAFLLMGGALWFAARFPQAPSATA